MFTWRQLPNTWCNIFLTNKYCNIPCLDTCNCFLVFQFPYDGSWPNHLELVLNILNLMDSYRGITCSWWWITIRYWFFGEVFYLYDKLLSNALVVRAVSILFSCIISSMSSEFWYPEKFLSIYHVGFEVYLVGGCVRDLILKRTPKDFDIITTAELKEVSLGSELYTGLSSAYISGHARWCLKIIFYEMS